jgi:hypothetical protein
VRAINTTDESEDCVKVRAHGPYLQSKAEERQIDRHSNKENIFEERERKCGQARANASIFAECGRHVWLLYMSYL